MKYCDAVVADRVPVGSENVLPETVRVKSRFACAAKVCAFAVDFSHVFQMAVFDVIVFALTNFSGIWKSSALSVVSSTIVNPVGTPLTLLSGCTSAWNDR